MNRNIYKPLESNKDRMFPGDPSGSPDDFSSSKETIVYFDEGFLDKLTRFFGNSKRLKFDKFEFAKLIAEKENLICSHLFYYTCPPFQSSKPTKDEIKRKKGYDRFVSSLSKNNKVSVREGRVQKIIDSEGNEKYNQKGVDTLLTIDLSHLSEDFSQVKKIILVSSDTDFCPIIRDIKERDNIEVILYTYFDKKRKSKFSLSNELISCCSKYVLLKKKDFLSVSLEKDENIVEGGNDE